MPVYLLCTLNPTKGVINKIYQLFAKFFWGKTGALKGKHWVAWDELCYPYNEGGVAFRSLHDVAGALFAKLWWNFIVNPNSLWGNFMWNKYCKKDHLVVAKGRGGPMSGR